MPDCLFEKRPDGVAVITLHRPERLNAMGGDMMPLLAQFLTECERDREVRCIAITGAGRAFCAGGDVGNMQKRNDGQVVNNEAAQSSNPIANLEQQVRELRRDRTPFRFASTICRSLLSRSSTATPSVRGFRSRSPAICGLPARARSSAPPFATSA